MWSAIMVYEYVFCYVMQEYEGVFVMQEWSFYYYDSFLWES